jgi:DNA-binding beta-propeller fold protein YncE
MANIRYFNIQDCASGNQYGAYFDDPSSTLIVGNTYLFSGTSESRKPIPYNCYTILGEKNTDVLTPNAVVLGSYGIEGCQECLDVNSNTLIFTDCSGVFGEVYFNTTDFTPTPTIGDVFYLDFYLSGKFGGNERYNGCFEFKEKSFTDPNRIRFATLFSATTQTDCETCLAISPIIYEVYECLTSDVYYVALPNNTYSNHLITFTDLGEITQFCGTVKEIIQGNPITGIVVTDLGNPESTGITCEDCLATVAEKTIITNCLDGHEDVVWASALFSVGEATNISTGQGCYEITGPADPSTGITYSELADFDPHADCENCIECHGVTYDFTTCTEITQLILENITSTGSYGGNSMVVDSNTNYAYVTSEYSSQVSVIDLNTNTLLNSWGTGGGNPRSLSLDENNGILVVANYYGNTFAIIDISTGLTTVVPNPVGSSSYPTYVYFNQNDSRFYITWRNYSAGNDFFTVYSITAYNSYTLNTTYYIGSVWPTSVIQIGSNLYFSCINGTILIRDAVSYNLLNTINVGYGITSMSYAGGTSIYLAGQSTQYSLFNISTTSLTNFSPGFNSCCCDKTILFDSVNSKLYVTDYCENAIYVIDSLTNTIINIYNNNIGDVNQVKGIFNNSGNVYFVSYYTIYTLGETFDFLNGSIDSYEYVQIGDSFYHPIYSVCCEVTGVRADLDGDHTFYSLISSGSCLDCSSTTYETFYCEECNLGITGLFVAPSGVYSVGEFVKSHWGNSDWLCFEIIDTWNESSYGVPDIIFEGENMSSYGTCEECQQNATVGITVINCDTLVPSYVSVTLPQWLEITGLNGISQPIISDTNGTCYTVINTCPIGNTGDEFPLVEFYLNQQQCRLDNTYFIYSANTEQPICILDCSGNTVTINPPHPVWTSGGTDGAGRLRTIIQLDAVQLGGTNGYYS